MMKGMPLLAALAAIAVAGGAGFAAGYHQGVGKGAEIIGTIRHGNETHQAFAQARAALLDIDAGAGAPPQGARVQLAMALETLSAGRASDIACSARDRETLQAMSRHLQAHPFPDGSPAAQSAPAALKYCD